MKPTFLVLYQFVLEGEKYTSHLQAHPNNISKQHADLPYFYSVVFIKKSGAAVTALGGMLIKSDIESTASGFSCHVKDVALALQPASSLVQKTNTFQVVPINEGDTLPLTEDDFHRIATTTITRVGRAGHA